MKLSLIAIVLFCGSVQNLAAQNPRNLQDSISTYFQEIKTATQKNESLWNKNLYGGILLVEPKTRNIFANEADTAGILKPIGHIYAGVLPDHINIANTSINWNGKNWAMIMLPLPTNIFERINLLTHELFHRAQPALGFAHHNPENSHLDQKDGRIYLRLELEALKKAVQASSNKELQLHLTNAFTFRKQRYAIYSHADSTENLLELNEGIAEYTGFMFSGRNEKQAAEHFVKSMTNFLANPSFVRSFAYQTTPVYGYLLSKKQKNWHKTMPQNLTTYFINAFGIVIPNDLKKAVENISENYNGKIIFAEETVREENIQKLIAAYKKKLIEDAHFEIRFEKMSVSFDPRNLLPLEKHGTVYPNIRISDNWGILTVEKGALMSPQWNKISISIPEKIDQKKITGDGWILELNEQYAIEKNETNGNYKLTKR